MRLMHPWRKLTKRWTKGPRKGQAHIEAYRKEIRKLLNLVTVHFTLCLTSDQHSSC